MERRADDATRIIPSEAYHAEEMARVAGETGLFPPELLSGMLSPYLAGDEGESWLTVLRGERPMGFCFAKSEALTDGTWNMLALAVRPESQGGGLGRTLVRAMEAHLAKRGARLLIVDTSGMETFTRTRQFYERNGYRLEARIRDYWAEGDDKVTFTKQLGGR